MRRRLFNFASSLSLLAAVVLAAGEILSLRGPIAIWRNETGVAGGKGATPRFTLVANNKLMAGSYFQTRCLMIGRHRITLADFMEPTANVAISSYFSNWGARSSGSQSWGTLLTVWSPASAQALQKNNQLVHEEAIFRNERGLYTGGAPRTLSRLIAGTAKPQATVQFWGATLQNIYADGQHLFRLDLPMWLVLPMLFLAPSIRFFLWWRRRNRFGVGHCSVCSYDLTGNTSGVCPECGTPTLAT